MNLKEFNKRLDEGLIKWIQTLKNKFKKFVKELKDENIKGELEIMNKIRELRKQLGVETEEQEEEFKKMLLGWNPLFKKYYYRDYGDQ